VDFLIDTPARWEDGPEIAAEDDRASLIAVGSAGDFLSRASNSSRAAIKADTDIRSKAASVPSP
jgi:hypothetical protein